MGWFSQKISVTFIDDATGNTIGTTTQKPGDLPETFEIQTTVHIGDADWTVVHAEPQTRSECTKSGSLNLRLRLIEKIDPAKILFSLPSICNRIAALGNGALSGDECILDEDEWRQLELVSQECAVESEMELEAIRRIHANERVGIGFRNIHVRRRPDPPIRASLTVKEIQQAFGGVPHQGVTYRGAPSPIKCGFSIKGADGLQCYGVESGSRVTVLGILQIDRPSPSNQSIDSLTQVAKAFQLDVVNWCQCARASCDDKLFRELLIGQQRNAPNIE